MAKLYVEMGTNRQQRRRVDNPHRLGDTWVEASVQNWDDRIRVILTDDGKLQISAQTLHSGRCNILYNGPIADALKWHLKEAVADDFRQPEPESVLVTTE